MIYEFEAIGTHWYIQTKDVPEATEQRLKFAIDKRIVAYTNAYSRFSDTSLVARIAKNSGDFAMPDDFEALFGIYKQMYALTDGAMTPLIGSALHDAGYDANYSLKSKTIRDIPPMPDVMRYKKPTLTTTKPLQLDFGAAGKGHLIDIVSEILEDEGLRTYMVDAGGDIRVRGNKIYRIGLENPLDTSEAIGVIELKNKSICGSAGNRRAWGNFTHIINPHTKASPTNIAAVWVCASTTLLADALTTALQFASVASLKKHFDFEAMLLFSDGHYEITRGWSAVLFE